MGNDRIDLTGQRYFAVPPVFNPDEGKTVLAPEGKGYGYWVGGHSVVFDPAGKKFYLRTLDPGEHNRALDKECARLRPLCGCVDNRKGRVVLLRVDARRWQSRIAREQSAPVAAALRTAGINQGTIG
jgi:hypothetical protein